MQPNTFGFEVRRHFDERAGRYDQDTETCDKQDFANFEHVIPYLQKLSGDSILEVATGSGIVLEMLLSANKNSYGLDFSTGLLRVAREKRPATESRLVCGDAERLPFPDDSFDATCVFRSLHHMENPHIVLREMFRCTRKYIFVYDNAGDWRRLVKRALTKAHLYQPIYQLLRGHPDTGYRPANETEGPVKVFYAEDAIPLLTSAGARIVKVSDFPSSLLIHAEKQA